MFIKRDSANGGQINIKGNIGVHGGPEPFTPHRQDYLLDPTVFFDQVDKRVLFDTSQSGNIILVA